MPGAPTSRDLAVESPSSLQSKRIMAFSSLYKYSAMALANSVFPVPGGPTNRRLAIGFLRFSLAHCSLIKRETSSVTCACPLTRSARAAIISSTLICRDRPDDCASINALSRETLVICSSFAITKFLLAFYVSSGKSGFGFDAAGTIVFQVDQLFLGGDGRCQARAHDFGHAGGRNLKAAILGNHLHLARENCRIDSSQSEIVFPALLVHDLGHHCSLLQWRRQHEGVDAVDRPSEPLVDMHRLSE